MKVLCIEKAYHKGEIWRKGEVYDYPEGETPPGYAFQVLETKKELEEAKKGTKAAIIQEGEEILKTGKDRLIQRAVAMNIGPPSTLARWGVDKLKEEIAKAES